MGEIDYTQLTKTFKERWNLIVKSDEHLKGKIQHLMNQIVETDDRVERGKLKTTIETYLDYIHTNRTAQLTLRGEYSFLCGKHFSEMWLPEGEVAITFDPKIQDFRME